MGKLIYTMNVSLDGFVETPDHSLDWAMVDEELHTWFNDHERTLDALLYGRRLYEVMAYWHTAESDPAATPAMLEYARIWTSKLKVVFSRSLDSVEGKSRLVSGDVAEELAKLKEEFGGNLAVGGPTLASGFVEGGLVDEFRLIVHPVILGAGKRFFPTLDRPIGLRLLETRTFESGVTYLGYAAT